MATVSQVTEAVFSARFDDQMTAGAAAAAKAITSLGTSVAEVDTKVTRATKTAQGWVNSTDAETKAAKAAEDAKKRLAAATKAVADAEAAGQTQTEAMGRTIKQLGDQADAAAARVKALQMANAGVHESFTTGTTGARNWTQAMGSAGFQIQDFAVQVQGGTSALTALSQQGSQFLGVFGTGGAIAGAVLTVGLLAAQIFGLTDKTKSLSDIVKINDEIYKRNLDSAKARIEGIKSEVEAVEQLRAGYVAMGAAGVRAEGVILARNTADLNKQGDSLTSSLGGGLVEKLRASQVTSPGADVSEMERIVNGGVIAKVATDMTAAIEAFRQFKDVTGPTVDGLRSYIAALDEAASSGGKNSAEIKRLRDAAADSLPAVASLEAAYKQNAVQAAAMRLAAGESAEAIVASANSAQGSSGRYAGLTGEIIRTAQALNTLRRAALDDPLAAVNAEASRISDQMAALRAGGTAAYERVTAGQEAQISTTERLNKITETYIKTATQSGQTEEAARAAAEKARPQWEQAIAARFTAEKDRAALLKETTEAEAAAARAATAAGSAGRKAASAAAAEAKHETQDAISLQSSWDKMWDAADKKAEDRAKRSADAEEAQKRQLELQAKEQSLVGAGADVRERELAVFRERQKIVTENAGSEATLDTESSKRRLEQAASYADGTTAIARQKDAMSTLENAGTQAFDRIGTAITSAFATGKAAAIDFGTLAKAFLVDLIQTALKLAVINPIKQWAFGSTSGGVSDLGGVASKLFGGGTSAGVGNTASSGVTGTTGGGSGVSLSDAGSLGKQAYSMFGSGGSNSLTGPGSSIYGIANTPLYSNAGPATEIALGQMGTVEGAAVLGPASPAAVNAAATGGEVSTLTVGGAATGVAGIAGGAYGIYSGLERGGTGGYTTAVGGAVGVAAGATALAAGAGLISAASTLAMLGPYGMVAAAVLMLVGSLLPGAKPSNKTGSAAVNVDTGETTIFGQTGNKYSQENRDSANAIAQKALSITAKLEELTGGAARGTAVIDVGNRDGLGARYHGPGGTDTDTQHFGNDEAGQKALMDFLVTNIVDSMRGTLPEALEHAVAGMAKTGAEQIVTDLAKFMDTTTKGVFSEAQTIASRNIDFSNTDAAVADLKWVRDVYDPLQKDAVAANEFQKQMDALTTKWGAITDQSDRLGLATDKIVVARDKEIAALVAQQTAIATNFDKGLTNRERVVSGTYVADPLAVALESFDANAKTEVASAKATLDQWGILAEDQSSRILRLETVLADERAKLISDTIASQRTALDTFDSNLRVRYLRASGDNQGADLAAFDLAAAAETKTTAAQLLSLGDSAADTATRMAALAVTLGLERGNIVKQYADAAAQVATQKAQEAAAAAKAIEDAAKAALQNTFTAAQSAYVTALQKQVTATQAAISAQTANTSALRGMATGLRSWVSALAVSAQSPATPEEQLNNLRSQFGGALATAGNASLSSADRATAAGQAQSLGSSLLTAAAAYYGQATAAYASEYESVSGRMSALADTTGTAADAAESSLKIAQSAYDLQQRQLEQAQSNGDAIVKSLDELRAAYLGAAAAAHQTVIAAGAPAFSGSGVANQVDAGVGGDMAAREAAYLKNNPDVAAAIAAGWYFGGGDGSNSGLGTSPGEAAYLHFVQYGQKEGRAFAAGGLAAPGWAMVGENGPEAVNFSRPGRVYTASETGMALRGSNDNSAVDEMRAMRAELASLRAVIAQGAMATVAAVEKGNGLAADGVTDRKLTLAR